MALSPGNRERDTASQSSVRTDLEVPEESLRGGQYGPAQRNVAPVPGGGGLRGLLSGFVNRRFMVRNPLRGEARITLDAELPPFLADRGWRIRVGHSDSRFVFGLAAGAERQVTVSLRPGQDFTRDDVTQAGRALSIRVTASADGVTFGGMTYRLDPDLAVAANETAGGVQLSPDDPAIDAMIEDARLQAAETSGATEAVSPPAAAAARRTERAPWTGDGDMDGDMDGGIGGLIARLGASDALRERIHRITLREVDIEMDDTRGRRDSPGDPERPRRLHEVATAGRLRAARRPEPLPSPASPGTPPHVTHPGECRA